MNGKFSQFCQFREAVDSRGYVAQQIKRFEEMVAFFRMDYGREWLVYVSWSEPNEQMKWQKFDGYGPLNERFIEFARSILEYWQDKAAVQMSVDAIINSTSQGRLGKDKLW